MTTLLDKELLWLAGIVGALITIWRGIEMVRKSGERHQELIDTIRELKKNEAKQDEFIHELDRKVDLLLTDMAIIKSKLGEK